MSNNTLPTDPSFQQQHQMQWTEAVTRLAELAMQEDACCLQMGDHLNFIEKQWNGRSKMKLAAQEAGVTWSLARQRSWVAKRIAPGHPLRDTQLSYTHLRAVADTNNPEEWGMKAIQNNWSVARLKEEIDLAEDKQAQQTGEVCHFCESQMDEEMVIVAFRVGREKTHRCCGLKCAIDYLQRLQKEAAGADEPPVELPEESESFSL